MDEIEERYSFSAGDRVLCIDRVSAVDPPIGTRGIITSIDDHYDDMCMVKWDQGQVTPMFENAMIFRQLARDSIFDKFQEESGTSYTQTKSKEEGSVKFGDVWITPVEEE